MRSFLIAPDAGVESDAVLMARFNELRVRVPVLYMVLISDNCFLSITHLQSAPAWLAIYAPAAISLLMAIRTVFWVRVRNRAVSIETARRLTRTLVRVSVLMSVASLAWALALYPYGDPEPHGSFNAHGQVVLYVGLTVLPCIFLLMHLPSAALRVTGVVVLPFSIYLLSSHNVFAIATGCNILVVAAAMLYVLRQFAGDFRKMVQAQTELQQLSDENARIAMQDTVTCLPNRRSFFEDLNKLAGANESYAVVVMDLDGFKQVNDIYGHIIGDAVLSEVARHLATFASAECVVARLGGDEFAMLVKGQNADSSAAEMARAIVSDLHKPIELDTVTVSIGVSVGMSIARGTTRPPTEHYEQADYALYQAKHSGRGRAEVFSQQHATAIRNRSYIESSLREANLAGELFVVYQPIVCSESGRINSFEALVRWNSPVCGQVPPMDFIPIAEKTGLIKQITQCVVRRALRDAGEWSPGVGLKINISILDLLCPDQIDKLILYVKESGLGHGRVTFEVTETAFAKDLDQAERSLAALRSVGCKVAIDDFGIEYSCLRYLHRLAPAVIKIDKCFVDNVAWDRGSQNIIRTIIDLAENIGAVSVAEGVESQEQIEVLKALGCDELQGYHFSRPVSQSAACAMSFEGIRTLSENVSPRAAA